MPHKSKAPESQEYVGPRHSPEKALLTAMLERAYFDLDYIKAGFRECFTAVQWFLGEEEYELSFEDAVFYLELSPAFIEKLRPAVEEAWEYVESRVGRRSQQERHTFAIEHGHQCAKRKRKSKYVS